MTFSRRLGASPCRWRIWGLAGILAILSCAVRAAGFIDLGYVVTPGGTPLVQVYDDGARTYLVFAKDLDARTLNQMSRSVMATRDGKMHFAALNTSSLNPSIVGVYDQVVLTVGGNRATATYVGSGRQSAAPAAREKTPPMEFGRRMSIQKDPVPEAEAEDAQPAVATGRGLFGRNPIFVPAGRAKPESLPGGQAAGAYPGGSGQLAAKPAGATAPWIEIGKPAPIQKTPVQEAPADEGQDPLVAQADEAPETLAAASGQPAEAAPGGRSLLESVEVLPSRQVVKVMAKSAEDPLTAVPVAVTKERAGAGRGAGKEGSDYKVEYKVMVPFTTGKTTLGKDGEKAMAEVTQIGPIAKEIRIRAPGDPGSNFQSAHSRAAEILKLLVKAGIVRQRISIEAVDAVPEGKVVQAEVALIIDLGSKVKKVDDSAHSEANRQTSR